MTSKLDNDGWPVTTQEPFDLVQEEGLAPGPALQACSGSDIILARGASSTPNPAKQKGRYVCLLPGILSLRTAQAVAAAAIASNKGEEKNEDDDDEEEEKDDAVAMTQDTNETLVVIKSSEDIKPSTTTKLSPPAPTSTLLGRIQGLSTSNPTLTIPYPNGGMLTFKGQKVNDSSSRFMMLSFKRGKVSCRDAVSSVICFGEGTYSGPSDGDDDIEVELEELVHYGGSDRTVDGGKSAKLKKEAVRAVLKTPELTTPALTEGVVSTKKAKTPSKGRLSSASAKEVIFVDSERDEEEDEDSDAYLDDGDGVTLTQSTYAGRHSLRRSTSSKKSYIDSDEEENEKSDDDDDSEEDKKPAKRTSVRKRASKIPIVYSNDSNEEEEEVKKPAKKAPTRKRSPKAKIVVEIGDDEVDAKPAVRKAARKRIPKSTSVVEIDNDENESTPPTKAIRKRTPNAKKAPSGESDASDDDEKLSSAETSKSSRQSLRRGTSAKKKSYTEKKESDDYQELEEEDKKKPAPKEPRSTKMTRRNPQKGVKIEKDVPEPLSQLSENNDSEPLSQSSEVSQASSSLSLSKKKLRKDDDDNEDESSESEEKRPVLKKAAARKRKVQTRTININGDDSEAENEPPIKKRVGRSKKGKVASQPIDIDDEEAPSSPPPKSVSKVKSPGGRRRRRRSNATSSCSSKQTPIATAKITKSHDSFGVFDFCADDEAIMTTPEKRVRLKRTKGKGATVDLT